jgi:hypothetical protein
VGAPFAQAQVLLAKMPAPETVKGGPPRAAGSCQRGVFFIVHHDMRGIPRGF